jgi:N-acetylmuramoyl-L-alanine amidase
MTVRRLRLPVIALALLSSGCWPFSHRHGETVAYTTVEINALARQLNLTVSRTSSADMVVLTGDRGTVVFRPRMSGILIGNQIRFRGFSPTIANGSVTLPPGFMAECDRLLRRPSVAVTVPPSVTPPPQRSAPYRVVIDPGHGGHDPGAPGVSGSQEKTVNLVVGRLIAAKLEGAGVSVTMTRSDDTFLELNDRAAVGSRINADVFVAIHADSNPSRSMRGFTVFVQNSEHSDFERAKEIEGESPLTGDRLRAAITANRSRSHRLATLIESQLNALGETQDRGVQPKSLRVLRLSVCPAALVEVGFMSNPSEEQRLLQFDYENQIATAIAKGILQFLSGG